MNHTTAPLPIIVGIDGSKQAVQAAIWALDEAMSRDTTLRLLHVIDGDPHGGDRDYADATDLLHEAWVAVQATGKPVKVQSDIRWGDPVTELAEVSRAAEMICVGAIGKRHTPHKRGSTAAKLAQHAHSPVAIVRRRHGHRPLPAGRWIIAALDESPDSHAVLAAAFDEAQLRAAPILALTPWSTEATDASLTINERDLRAELERYRDEVEDDDADVQVCTLPMPTKMSKLLEQAADIDQLVIVGAGDPDLVAEIVGPKARVILAHTNCSLLILRDRPT